MLQDYEQLSDEAMRQRAKTMKEFARKIPFDTFAAAKDAVENHSATKNKEGIVRVTGKSSLELCGQYMTFILLDNQPLQVIYYEIPVPNGLVGQLTIVNNIKFPLTDEIKKYLSSLFFDLENLKYLQTPPHVFVGIQKVNDDEI